MRVTGMSCIIDEFKRLKEQHGYTQSELSRITGVTQKTISRMENGLSEPTLSTVSRLFDGMGYGLTFSIKDKDDC